VSFHNLLDKVCTCPVSSWSRIYVVAWNTRLRGGKPTFILYSIQSRVPFHLSMLINMENFGKMVFCTGSFICQGISTKKAKDLFDLCVKLLPVYLFNHSKVEAIPLSTLSKNILSELVGLFSHYPFNAEGQAGKL